MAGQQDFTPEELQVLRPLFVSSGRKYLETFGELVAELQAHPVAAGDARLELLHRSIHSLKGAALQLGLLQIGALAKATEMVAKALRGPQVGPVELPGALLAESRQLLLDYLDGFERGESEDEPPADLLARLDAAARTVSGEVPQQRAAGQ